MKPFPFAAFVFAVIAVPNALASQEREVAGTFFTVWSDPRPGGGPAEVLHMVQRDDGRVEHVRVPEAVLRAHGGAGLLDRRHVRLRLDRRSALTGSRVTPLQIESIRDVQMGRFSERLPQPSAIGATVVKRYVTLLCKFADWPDLQPGTVADAERMMSATYPGAAHYFNEVSFGQLSLAGSVVKGWYLLPHPKSHYVGPNSANTTSLGADCAAAADHDVHFPDFDGVNFILNTDIGCCAFGGSGGLSLDGGPRGYAMTWLHGDVIRNVGILKHEMGHSLGLQHSSGSYGLVYDSRWDVMSNAAWYQVPGTDFLTGSHINAYGKRQLGWIPAQRQLTITPGSHTFLLENLAMPGDNANVLVARIPAPALAPWEYFLIEARGVSGYDAPLPGAGVIIHRVGGGGATASNVLDPDGNFEPSDAGAVLEPGEWYLDRANGIYIAVEERVGNAFRVRVSVNEFPRITLGGSTREVAVAAGSMTVIRDSATVEIRGTGSAASWTAGMLAGGPVLLETSSGSGDGMLRWSIDTRGLGAGQYQQAIRVRSGALPPAELSVRVVVSQAAILTAGLTSTVLTDSVIAGRMSGGFVGNRTSGVGNDTASWTLTADSPWISVLTPSGTGRGDLQFRRDASGLAPGVHVARLTFTVPSASNGPVTLVDSLRVLEAPTLTVTARGRARTAIPQGGAPEPDSLYVQLSGGNWAASGSWFAGLSVGQYLVLGTQPTTPGSGWFRFTRMPRDLAPGVYPGKFRATVAAASDVFLEVEDTLEVIAAAPAIRLSRTSKRDSVVSTFIPVRDSVWVQTEGPNSTSRGWNMFASSSRIFPLSSSLGGLGGTGTGPGWLHWVRNLGASATPGLYVDTITVSFASGEGSAARLVDTLFMFGPPSMALAAGSGKTQALARAITPFPDSTRVEFSGWDAQAIAWSASATRPWTTVNTSAGTGSGMLRWTRTAASLDPGLYVDTITVTALVAGTPVRFIDTLLVYGQLVVTSDAGRPAATMGAPFADTIRWEGGPEGVVAWSVVAGSLPAGLSLEPTTGRLIGIPEAAGSFDFTGRISVGQVTAEKAFTIEVGKPALAATAVIDDLLGATPLSVDHRRFLDLQGNRNGRVDIGDVRAWLLETGAAATASEAAQLVRRRAGDSSRTAREPQ